MSQPRVLPTVRLRGKAYTVDERLGQIRHIEPDEPMEFIDFSELTDAEWDTLTEQMKRRGNPDWPMPDLRDIELPDDHRN